METLEQDDTHFGFLLLRRKNHLKLLLQKNSIERRFTAGCCRDRQYKQMNGRPISRTSLI
jgi:hypothetical protein